MQQTFRFLHTLIVRKDFRPNTTTPPTILEVEQLPIALPDGYVIKFPIPKSCETIDLIVDGGASLGDTQIPIEPYTGTKRLSCKTTTKILPVNLTGVTWRGAIRTGEADTLPLLTFDFVTTDPLSGIVTMSADAIDTAALPSNCRFDELPLYYETPLSIQKAENFEDQAVYNAAYFWDAEYEDTAGVVTRQFYGRVWVPWESTQ